MQASLSEALVTLVSCLRVTVQTWCDMDSFALRQGESPHLNLPPRGEEAEPPPLDSEHLRLRCRVTSGSAGDYHSLFVPAPPDALPRDQHGARQDQESPGKSGRQYPADERRVPARLRQRGGRTGGPGGGRGSSRRRNLLGDRRRGQRLIPARLMDAHPRGGLWNPAVLQGIQIGARR